MSSELDAVADTLRHWIEGHNAIESAKQSFYKALESYPPVFRDILRDSFTIEALRVSYVLSWPDCKFCCVVASIPHTYQLETFGWYRVFFEISGAVQDDSWYFDEEFARKLLVSQQEKQIFLGEPRHE